MQRIFDIAIPMQWELSVIHQQWNRIKSFSTPFHSWRCISNMLITTKSQPNMDFTCNFEMHDTYYKLVSSNWRYHRRKFRISILKLELKKLRTVCWCRSVECLTLRVYKYIWMFFFFIIYCKWIVV